MIRLLATAGHVDHGKSSLVRRLTGMEPDRWESERERGLTIDLGFAWLSRPNGDSVVFIDVPGHEKYVPNMLAGAGPIESVIFVVAADQGWQQQSTEHLQILDALGVASGVLVISRSDLADPEEALNRSRSEMFGTSLEGLKAVCVSARTGEGCEELLEVIDAELAKVKVPSPSLDVRLWIDRSFVIRGAGTVVTGTLSEGTIHRKQNLVVARSGLQVAARRIESLGSPEESVAAPSRVALNLPIPKNEVKRGDALVESGKWVQSTVVDVQLSRAREVRISELMFHIGTAAVPTKVRVLDRNTLRLNLRSALPLRFGDQGLLRNPGNGEIIGGAYVIDAAPEPRRKRKPPNGTEPAPSGRAQGTGAAKRKLHERGFMSESEFSRLGLPTSGYEVAPRLFADPEKWRDLAQEATAKIEDAERSTSANESAVTLERLRSTLGLPTGGAIRKLVADLGLFVSDDAVVRSPTPAAGLVAWNEHLSQVFPSDTFMTMTVTSLREEGFDSRILAQARQSGDLLDLGGGTHTSSGSIGFASEVARSLPQPFTVSQLRIALSTNRQITLKLLALLERRGVTSRTEAGHHIAQDPTNH